MEESDELQHVLLEQQTHELVCPDCEACITHEVIVRKRKRDLNEAPSLRQQYPAGEVEEYDPDSVLPHMLFEQESHDLICPVCEHAVTGEVILQKRKREVPVQSDGKPHGIQANLNEKYPRDSIVGVTEEDELEKGSAIQEQENYDLLCPDCDSCITDDVIVQKRKRAASASDAIPGRKPWTEGLVAQQDKKPPLHSHRPRTRRAEGIEEQGDSGEANPPLKRYRRTERAAGADPEEEKIRRMLQDQRIYDLTCPDCASRITYQVVLKDRTSESGKPIGLLENRGRRQRRVTSYIDDNPWKTRYELLHGHSKPYGVSKALLKADEREHPQQRAANYGAIANRSLRADPQPQVAEYGAVLNSSLRDDPQRPVAKYEANANNSLTEPLLPVQRQATGEAATAPMTIKGRYKDLMSKTEDFIGPALLYFLVLLLLYCVWYILRVIPPA